MIIHTDKRPPENLVKIYDGNLTEDFCNLCIREFEKDDRKDQGITARGVLTDVKDSIDLYISDKDEWKSIDILLHSALSGPAQDMFEILEIYTESVIEPRDTGYQIQRTSPTGGYVWHNDTFVYEGSRHRLFSYIWYLNTIEEGGETEFLDFKIKPVAGRLVLFPSTWTFLHRGLPPKTGMKYICTGWMTSSTQNPEP